MKIEVGKLYKDREDRVVKITNKNDHEYAPGFGDCWQGDNGIHYNENGRSYNDSSDYPEDLIKEVCLVPVTEHKMIDYSKLTLDILKKVADGQEDFRIHPGLIFEIADLIEETVNV
jgi:hypothetical protein